MLSLQELFNKATEGHHLSLEEGVKIWHEAPLSQLMHVANTIREKLHPEGVVTWIIDRNINITNICICGCKFCNFKRRIVEKDTYVTSISQYKEKIDELYALGGRQVLLQGGHHPKHGLAFYKQLFEDLKKHYPDLHLHALGPPEIAHIASRDKIPTREVLKELIASGLGSLPGAGAEILSDRVRSTLSPGKCNSDTWLNVMREAHQLGLSTSATMMFGHLETIEERINHLCRIRALQEETHGFVSFIPWTLQSEGTELASEKNVQEVTSTEYIRLLSLSRIMLPNIKNIQASWLTVGIPTGQVCLHAGANDFGSIMIEENVVSAAGAKHRTDKEGLPKAIEEAGFIPRRRNQRFDILS